MAKPSGQDPRADKLTDQPTVADDKTVSETDRIVDDLPNEAERRRRRILEIANSYRMLLIVDPRDDDEILGYNEHGTFD